MKTRYDRAANMRDAHKRYREGKRLRIGWSFGLCLSTAWQATKRMRDGARGPAKHRCFIYYTGRRRGFSLHSSDKALNSGSSGATSPS